MTDEIGVGDDVLLDSLSGIVLGISRPFKCGNITYADGSMAYGREYTVFVEEEENG